VVGRRAELLFEQRRDEEAKDVLATLAARGDEGALAACEILQRRERYAESLPRLRELAKRQPGAVPVLFRLGAALERTGERDEAVRTFRSVLEQQPDFAPALNYLGYMWIEKGENLEQATAFVRRALARDPESGAYVDSLGWAYFQAGDRARAKELLERAARLLPDDATVLEHLGDSYRATGDLTRARATYERALALDGEHPEELRRKLAATGEKP
jgi:tetratricopeptide (TPR) repeat protein